VTLQDEREQRHSEQMRMLHPRGSGIVVDASYTLCKYLMAYDILVFHKGDYEEYCLLGYVM
jgi:hypothetical protein